MLFASYRTGGYANTIHNSIEDIVELIKNYIEMEEVEGYEVKWEDGEIEKLAYYIQKELNKLYRHDTMIKMTDDTWFLITRTYKLENE